MTASVSVVLLSVNVFIRERFIKAYQGNKVVIVTSSTGSGKTTQIPKFVLLNDLLYLKDSHKRIGVSQPRVVAATESATRVALELDVSLGEHVGYRVGGSRMISDDTVIEFMTDGFLATQAYLVEDRNALAKTYGTIIIDEAHERSLDTDIVLALLRPILENACNDLKLIIMSATLNAKTFLDFFPGSEVVHIAGSTPYPIEVRYLDGSYGEYPTVIQETIVDIFDEGLEGDILVFLPGEDEISTVERAIRGAGGIVPAGRVNVHVLFGAMSRVEKAKVLTSHLNGSPRTRVILATNIAETSLTVENVVHVIDSGLARVDIYNPHTKCDELRLAVISKGSANQRKGRVGRTRAGYCWRVYTEKTFEEMPDHLPVPMTRSRLSRRVLGLRNALPDQRVEAFRFLDPPSEDLLYDAYQDLWFLQLVDGDTKITDLGRAALKLGCDLEIAVMMIAAKQFGAAEEGISLAAMLSVRRPDKIPKKEVAFGQNNYSHDGDLMVYVHAMHHPLEELRSGKSNSEEGRKREDLSKRLQRLDLGPDRQLPPDEMRDALRKAVLAAFPHKIAVNVVGETYRDLRTEERVALSKFSVVSAVARRCNPPSFPEFLIYTRMIQLPNFKCIGEVLVVSKELLQEMIPDFNESKPWG